MPSLIPTDKCSSNLSSSKVLFYRRQRSCRKPQLVKIQRTIDFRVPICNWSIPQLLLIWLKECWRGSRKILRTRGPGHLLWGKCLLSMSGSYRPEISRIWLNKEDLYSDNTSWQTNEKEETLQGHMLWRSVTVITTSWGRIRLPQAWPS